MAVIGGGSGIVQLYPKANGHKSSFPQAGNSLSIANLAQIQAFGTPTVGGGAVGGNAALAFSAPNGIGYGRAMRFTTDGTNPLGLPPQAWRHDDLSAVSIGQALTIGNTSFDQFAGNPLVLDDPNAPLGKSIRIWNGAYDNVSYSIYHLDFPCTEFYMEWTVTLYPGTRFPSAGATGRFPRNSLGENTSVWKMQWLEDIFLDANRNDCILLNHSGDLQFTSPDSNGLGTMGYLNDYVGVNPVTRWDWNGPNHFAVGMRADPINPNSAPSQYYFRMTNVNGTVDMLLNPLPTTFGGATPHPIFQTGVAPYQWNYLLSPGYVGNFAGPTSIYDPRYSNYWIGYGTNSRATVHFGDRSTWGACTKLFPADLVTRSNGAIDVLQTFGNINPAAGMWAYITQGSYFSTVRYSLRIV